MAAIEVKIKYAKNSSPRRAGRAARGGARKTVKKEDKYEFTNENDVAHSIHEPTALVGSGHAKSLQ